MPRPQYTVERLDVAATRAQEAPREEYESYIKSDGVDITCKKLDMYMIRESV